MAARPLRALVVVPAVLLLVAALFTQAAASVREKDQPDLAVQLAPYNGAAHQERAVRQFEQGVRKPDDLVPAARAAAAESRRAAAHDPLVPRAYAILAIAEGDPAKKRALLGAASAINRRELLLQGLVLEDAVARGDYPTTLATLDAMLRVHPEQKNQLFPVLARALEDPAALPAMRSLLDRGPQWREDFLLAAAHDKAALVNLARLRLSRGKVDPAIDRKLVAGLAESGRLDLASEVYAAATGQRAASSAAGTGRGALAWTSDFAPLDWALADDPGFRAQRDAASPALEVNVRPGKGGVIARRIIATPPGAFAIEVGHDLGPAAQVGDVRLQLRCVGSADLLFDEPFRVGSHRFRIPSLAGRCGGLDLQIYARAWSGRKPITGTINPLALYPA